MENLNNIECTIVVEIGRYNFCTVSHLQKLTGKSVSYLRESLARLRRFGYLQTFTVVVTQKIRAEVFYYLSQKAAEFLVTYKNAFPEDIHVPVGAVMASRDYFHRYFYVWLTIALRQYAEAHGIEIIFLHSYFSKTGSNKKGNLKAKTEIPLDAKSKKYYVPDGVLKTAKGLYLLELYNDHSIQRIIGSLATHAQAISLGTPGQTFDVEANPKILAVFTHESTMKSVIKRLQANANFVAPMSKLFYFATLSEIQRDVRNAKDIDNIQFDLR
jgi:hypothetical protein